MELEVSWEELGPHDFSVWRDASDRCTPLAKMGAPGGSGKPEHCVGPAPSSLQPLGVTNRLFSGRPNINISRLSREQDVCLL